MALGTPVAILVDSKDEVAKWANYTLDMIEGGAPKEAAPSATKEAVKPEKAPEKKQPSSPQPHAAPSAGGSRVIASPRARMEATKKGVNLSEIAGAR